MTEPLLQVMEFEAPDVITVVIMNRLWSRTILLSVPSHSRKKFPFHTVLPAEFSDAAKTVHSSAIVRTEQAQSLVMVKLDS